MPSSWPKHSKARYQVRFVGLHERCHAKSIEITDSQEKARWKQYYLDQRARIRLDPALTYWQRKEIAEACDAYEWRPDRQRLIREPIEIIETDQ